MVRSYVIIHCLFSNTKNHSSGAQNWVGKKKVNKKKGMTTTYLLPATNFVPGQIIHFLIQVLPFFPSFNLQKLFLMFSISTIYPKDILRKQFLQESFSEKKKTKKIIHFFFDFFVLGPKPTQHLFLSILLIFIIFQKKKKKNRSKKQMLCSTSTF